VVLARGVPQGRVIFLCMIATPEGVSRVARTYPGVKIVASEVDARLDERWRVVPGIGQFGDRYYGL
jgi:uridine kinase